MRLSRLMSLCAGPRPRPRALRTASIMSQMSGSLCQFCVDDMRSTCWRAVSCRHADTSRGSPSAVVQNPSVDDAPMSSAKYNSWNSSELPRWSFLDATMKSAHLPVRIVPQSRCKLHLHPPIPPPCQSMHRQNGRSSFAAAT